MEPMRIIAKLVQSEVEHILHIFVRPISQYTVYRFRGFFQHYPTNIIQFLSSGFSEVRNDFRWIYLLSLVKIVRLGGLKTCYLSR